ncbi:MAG: phosphoglycerate mutase, partial [Pseudomonadota bacterium]
MTNGVPADDRLPVVLIVLDGLGDRPAAALGNLTPSEAADVPALSALVRCGQSGVHVPFGPGRCTSSETAHWALFGFDAVPFPGRAALEALGSGIEPPPRTPHFHLALRAGVSRGESLFLGARARRGRDDEDAAGLFAELATVPATGAAMEILPLRTGEAVLVAHGVASHHVSDSDALFDHIHPWLRPLPLADAAQASAAATSADTLTRWLLDGHRRLHAHPINDARRRNGLPPLDIPVTKWASRIDPDMPSFERHVGVRGAAVTDTALYRGLAKMLGMHGVDIAYDAASPCDDMRRRLEAAASLLGDADFVHVHVKATDAAGHTKDPAHKRDVIAATAAGLDGLPALAGRAVVAVTGDHATPSTGSLLHSGDPTPLVVAGPGIRPDAVEHFGERPALNGELGRLGAADILPLLLGLA